MVVVVVVVVVVGDIAKFLITFCTFVVVPPRKTLCFQNTLNQVLQLR